MKVFTVVKYDIKRIVEYFVILFLLVVLVSVLMKIVIWRISMMIIDRWRSDIGFLKLFEEEMINRRAD